MKSEIDACTANIDTLPLIKHYMTELGVYPSLKEFVPKGGAEIEPAECLCVMISNIINNRKPLYKVNDWLADYADGRGEPHVNADKFNDDRLARCLDGLYEADRNSLIARLSANAIRVHELEVEKIHNDTTSVTLFGAYDNPQGAAALPMHGYNKDGRSDCKQIVFGLNVTEDGHVPLSYETYDGNTMDSSTHISNWDALRRQLGAEDDFIYIADSKLCSMENMAYIAGHNGKFITLMPKNRKEAGEFHARLKAEDVSWVFAFEREDSRKKGQFTVYQIYEGEKTREGYRIVWVHSSAKEALDEKNRQKLIKKTLKKLEKLASKLNRYKLKTEEQIKSELEKIIAEANGYIDCRIIKEETIITRQIGPGKPGPETKYRKDIIVSFRLEWSVNESAVAEAARTDGVFPLVDNTDLSASEVLKTYKEQPYLEKRYSTLKSVLEVSPIFLKKSERIEAMMFLFFAALMIVSLIERNIRANMTGALPILPAGMKTETPTWENIRYFFRNVHQIVVTAGGRVLKTCMKGMTKMHEQLLKLLEVPRSAYERFKGRWQGFDGGW